MNEIRKPYELWYQPYKDMFDNVAKESTFRVPINTTSEYFAPFSAISENIRVVMKFKTFATFQNNSLVPNL